jgi:hypothetical protein
MDRSASGDQKAARRRSVSEERVMTPRSWENRRTHGILEVDAMDKKAKTPKKPKQTKTKDGAAKGK